VLRDDALQAGLSFLPVTLAVFTGSSLAPRLVARVGLRGTVTLGMLAATAGLLLLTDIHPHGSYFTLVLPGGILSGLGMGLGLVGSTIAATQGVPLNESGLASGLLNTSRLLGGALGLAVLSTIAAAQARSVPGFVGLTNGFTVAFEIGAIFCIAGAALALLLLRPSASETVAHLPERGEAQESEALAA
jgi:MFS family permease